MADETVGEELIVEWFALFTFHFSFFTFHFSLITLRQAQGIAFYFLLHLVLEEF
jgi:hypothetical protein